jgi:hypothetical protein
MRRWSILVKSFWHLVRWRRRRRAIEREVQLEQMSADERRLMSESLEDVKADRLVEDMRHGDFFAERRPD